MLYVAGPIGGEIGNLNERRSLVVRLITGVWCLACFVLITAYCSVLISFLTAPDKPLGPLINSIDDLPNRSEIKVNVMKGWGPDFVFRVILFLQFTTEGLTDM